MIGRPPRSLQRLAFSHGEEILRADFRDMVAYEARLLAMHVRAMHDMWGIALGLGVTLDADSKTVDVARGAAYTCRGDVLVVGDVTTLHAPTQATPSDPKPAFDLVLRARNELAWVHARTTPSGAVRFSNDLQLGEEIPIARFVRHSNGKLTGPDSSVRHNVRPMQRPFVAYATTAPGQLEWKRNGAELVATVDTKAAAFATTPVYLASLSGVPNTKARVGPWLHIEKSTPTSFSARAIASVAGKSAAKALDALAAEMSNVSLAWIGVEKSTSKCGGTTGTSGDNS